MFSGFPSKSEQNEDTEENLHTHPEKKNLSEHMV